MQADVAREMERTVLEELGRFGASGRVRIDEHHAHLETEAGVVSVELNKLAEQWAVLPPENQRKKAQEIARILVEKAKETGAKVRQKGTGFSVGIATLVGLGAVVILGAYLTVKYVVARVNLLGPDETTAPVVAQQSDVQRREALCDATRDRIRQGASVNGLGLDGWVVELWVAGGPSAPDLPAQLSGVVEDGRIKSAFDDELAKIAGDVSVQPGLARPHGDAVEERQPFGAVLRMDSADFFEAYVDAEGRRRFVSAAERIVQEGRADYAALYARCSHRTEHDVAAWIRGPNPAAAAAVLVFAVDTFSADPVMSKTSVSNSGKVAVETLSNSAQWIDKDLLARLTGNDGGSVSERKEPAGVVLSFSAPIGTNAGLASRQVATALRNKSQ